MGGMTDEISPAKSLYSVKEAIYQAA